MNFFDLEPGTQADWVGACGTALAFVIAAIGYVRSVARARKAQARRVYAHMEKVELRNTNDVDDTLLTQLEWGVVLAIQPRELADLLPGPPEVPQRRYNDNAVRFTIKVHNGSDEIMGPLRVELVDRRAGKLLGYGDVAIDRVEPGDSTFVVVIVPDVWRPAPPRIKPRIVFRDSSGKWWHRYDGEPVRSAPFTIQDSTSDAEQLARELRSQRKPQSVSSPG